MKHTIIAFFALAICCAMAFQASAQDKVQVIPGNSFMTGGLRYEVNPDGYTVKVKYTDYVGNSNYAQLSGEVSIPEWVSYRGFSYMVTSINNRTFYKNTRITRVHIPNTVTSIGSEAFAGCTALTEVTIPNSVTELGDLAFDKCSSLLKVVIGSSVATIDDYAFYNCTALREIHSLNEQPPAIGFFGCFQNVPETVFIYVPYESIEKYKRTDKWNVFLNYYETPSIAEHRFIDNEIRYVVNDDCASVSVSYMSNDYDNYESMPSTLRIPEWIVKYNYTFPVTEIGESAFINCDRLRVLYIPRTVHRIQANAFWNARDLEEIHCLNPYPPVVEEAGTETINRSMPIYVPFHAIKAYKQAPFWKEFTNIQPYAQPGDIDMDNNTDVSDLNILINIILDKAPADAFHGLADLNGDEMVDVSDINKGTNIITGKDDEDYYGNHYYVDLGLPGGVLWATCNIGADRPEDWGRYFAWGETEGYLLNEGRDFNWRNYEWIASGYSSWEYANKYTTADGKTEGKWYNNGNYVGTTVEGTTYKNLTQLLPEDDAAITCWGDGWRMPTYQEASDLINEAYTTCELTKQRGVEGVKITSKSNGNSIFLPTAGEIVGSGIYWANYAHYWTSTLYTGDSSRAMMLCYPRDSLNALLRSYGLPIRPVRTK